MSAFLTTGTSVTLLTSTPSHTVSIQLARSDIRLTNTTTVVTDVNYFAATQPEILAVGCNQGRVNSYNAIDYKTLTSGAYTAAAVAANPICFASSFAKAEAPLITGLNSTALAPLNKVLDGIVSTLKCPAITKVNQSALTACPGFSLYGGPTGPVAPGAIQS